MIKQMPPRQRQIVALLADGKPSRTIAKDLGLSIKTVENHIYAAGLTIGAIEKVQTSLVAWHYRQRIAELEATIANLTAAAR